MDRIGYVTSLLERLDKQGWPNKSDIGWSDHDLEVLVNRWVRLELTTVAEDHPQGKRMIRCRLRTSWSLQAKIAFWSALGFELLVLGFVGRWVPWLWCLLASLPLLAWSLVREERNLRSLMVVFLDELAKQWNLLKVPLPDEARKTEKPGGA